MKGGQLHIVFTMANNSSAPYFNWFAERCSRQSEVKLSFVCLYPTRPQMIEDVSKYGCECHWIKFDDKKRKSSLIRSTYQLFRLFRKLQPDAVHSHLFDDATASLLAARAAGVRIRAITKADAGFHYYYARKMVLLDKFNNWNATHIVAISEENKKFVLEKENAKEAKVSVIHHGIPEDIFTARSSEDMTELKKKFSLEEKTVIGTVARLIDWKGYKYIIEAASKLVADFPNLRFVFAGVGEQLDELSRLVAEHDLENHIIFTGWVDRKMIPSLYGIMDVYVHAASYEPFGFVIAEAMINKLPLVSTKTGAALDAIDHQQSGFLVEHADSAGIEKGIRFMLENDKEEIGEKGYKTASKMFAFERMWLDHINLYR